MSNRIEMYRFDKGELASLDIMSPKFGKWAGEGEWLNQLIGIAESRGITFYSANYKETSGRDEDGANLFIKLDELGIWRAVLLEFLCEGFLVNGPFTFVSGKHGDDVLKFEGNQITITKRSVKQTMPTDRESTIVINGVTLTEAQSMTVRVAVQNFSSLCQDGLGDDEHGKAMTKGYLKAIREINALLAM